VLLKSKWLGANQERGSPALSKENLLQFALQPSVTDTDASLRHFENDAQLPLRYRTQFSEVFMQRKALYC